MEKRIDSPIEDQGDLIQQYEEYKKWFYREHRGAEIYNEVDASEALYISDFFYIHDSWLLKTCIECRNKIGEKEKYQLIRRDDFFVVAHQGEIDCKTANQEHRIKTKKLIDRMAMVKNISPTKFPGIGRLADVLADESKCRFFGMRLKQNGSNISGDPLKMKHEDLAVEMYSIYLQMRIL